MSSYKFSSGQMVEFITSPAGNTGKRFIVTKREYHVFKGQTRLGKQPSYWCDFINILGTLGFWAKETQLKLVNPDGDSLSEYTFEELMLELNTGILV